MEDQGLIGGSLANFSAAKVLAYDNHSIPKPTYIKTNEFTASFQMIVDTYGIPSYQEGNPTVINIVTFPFFFGMMFGDMGHGSILLAFASFIVLFHNQLKNTGLAFLGQIRYMLLLMGIMATFCGFVYNEFFSIPTNIFNTCFNTTPETASPTINEEGDVEGEPYYKRLSTECTYPFGIDPIWGLSSGRLTFSNSVKMKISVIFAVLHMTTGILIKGTNSIYFGRYIDLFAEVIPGTLILLGLFGWMDLLIFAKWFTPLDIDDTSDSLA